MSHRFVGVVLSIASCCNFAWCSRNLPSWHLSTDDTAVVVTVRQDTPVVTQLRSTKRHSWNWFSGPVVEVLLPSVTRHGVATPTHWRYAGGSLDRPSGELVLRFENSAPALEIQSIWRARPGRGPVEHWLTIANHSGDTITIGHQDSLVLQVAPPSDQAATAWWVNRGGGNAITEGGTFTRGVGGKFDVLLKSDPMNGASPVPWLALESGEAGGLYVGWEFSGLGRIRATAEGNANLHQLKIEVGNRPEFMTDLPPGETFLVPPAFVGCYLGDVDDGSYTLHRFVLEKLRPKLPPNYPTPTLSYNPYLDAGGQQTTGQSLLYAANLAKQLGFEIFVVDAVWFPQSGDWRWDPSRFPRGDRPIEQYVHSRGMKFGLWMAYTHGSDSNDPAALNIFQHPDWFAAPPKLDHEGHLNWDALIDLGYDPARDWVERATEHAVSEYKLDLFKTDYSPIVTQCRQTNHRHRYGVDVSYWSTLGYYAVQENLLQKFPHLMIEGCSGAGHIKDFGDIQRVHTIAVTDTLAALPDRDAIYDSTFAFPPAVLTAYTYDNEYRDLGGDAPEPYLWRSAMMSAWEIAPTRSVTWTPDERAKVKREVEVYKSWIRPILQDVEVHHILPRPDGRRWDGMFYWSPNLKRGTVYIFRPNSDETTQQVLLKGLQPGGRFKVHAEDGSAADATCSGAALMSAGLTIHLPARYSSDLIYVEQSPFSQAFP